MNHSKLISIWYDFKKQFAWNYSIQRCQWQITRALSRYPLLLLLFSFDGGIAIGVCLPFFQCRLATVRNLTVGVGPCDMNASESAPPTRDPYLFYFILFFLS